ncbi:MFS transporter [Pseudonocardia sp. ICBG601]|uniref:MFS transporter n=1 Tax=Pseudonocardia sp. ICBG601 TaxID=2846759 RepID=UPI001CF653E6|nr:MFS transporter [Pseudonocardia sp. ICBG601]
MIDESGDRTVRRVRITQLVGSTVDGAVLATAVLYFSTRVGLAAETVGLVLAVAAACALGLSVPIGVLADAVGLRRAGVALSGLVVVSLVVYALAGGLVSYAAGAICFVVAQAGIGAVRQAVVAAAVAPEDRVRARAALHALLNAGMGLGTVWGAVVLAADSAALYRATFVGGAAAALVCTVLFAGLPATAPTRGGMAAGRRPGLAALRDGRFVTVTGLSALLQLTMPVLSVILPLWVATRTGAPEWVAAVALGLNTILVLLLQTAWAARIGSVTAARRSAVTAGTALLVSCVLIGLAGSVGGAVLPTVLVLIGVTVLTAGEIGAGAATWFVAFRSVPEGAQGQYQAVFGMAASFARIIGPALVLPLVLATGEIGWLAVGAVMAAAGIVLSAITGRSDRTPPQLG